MKITKEQLKQIIKEEMGNTNQVIRIFDSLEDLLRSLVDNEEDDEKREQIERVFELINYLEQLLEG